MYFLVMGRVQGNWIISIKSWRMLQGKKMSHTLQLSSPQPPMACLGGEIGHILNNTSTPGAREQ